jgi:hypothetical protein
MDIILLFHVCCGYDSTVYSSDNAWMLDCINLYAACKVFINVSIF